MSASLSSRPSLSLLRNTPPHSTAHLKPRHICENAVHCDDCLRVLASVLAQDLSAGLSLPREGHALLNRALNKPAEWYQAQVGEDYSLGRCAELRRMVVAICHPGMRVDGLEPLRGNAHLASAAVADFSEEDFHPVVALRIQLVSDAPAIARHRWWYDFLVHPLTSFRLLAQFVIMFLLVVAVATYMARRNVPFVAILVAASLVEASYFAISRRAGWLRGGAR